MIGRLRSRIAEVVCDTRLLITETINWKRPVASSLYLLVVNACFWYVVFYMEKMHQLLILASVVCFILVLDLFSRVVYWTPVEHLKTACSKCRAFAEKTTSEKAMCGLRFVLTLGPLRLILLPLISFCWSWLYYKMPELGTVCLCSSSYFYLDTNDVEKACWLAYCTVLLLLVTPPWRSNRVSQQIFEESQKICNKTAVFIRENVLSPIYRSIRSFVRSVRYVVLGEWIPPLVEKLKAAYRRLVLYLRTSLWEPFVRGLKRTLTTVRYYLFGYWIPPLLTNLKARCVKAAHRARDDVWRPIVHGANSFWEAVKFVVLLKWIPILCSLVLEKCLNPLYYFVQNFNENVYNLCVCCKENVYSFCTRVRDNVCSFCTRVKENVYNFCFRLKESVLYVVLGKWIPGFLHWLAIQKSLFGAFFRRKMWEPLCAKVNDTQLKLRQCVYDLYKALQLYLYRNVLQPSVQFVRQLFFKTKRAIVEKILKPTTIYVFGVVRATCEVVYAQLVVPLWIYCAVWLKRSKHYAWIQWIEPGKEWLIERMPKRLPFVEDSDTEFVGFLPESQSKAQSVGYSSSSDEEELSPAHFTPSLPPTGGSSNKMSRRGSDDSDDIPFSTGLAFPSLNDGDSSDEEFSLSNRQQRERASQRRQNRPSSLRHRVIEKSTESTKRPTTNDSSRIRQSFDEFREPDVSLDDPQTVPDVDDEFELLDVSE